MAPLESLPPDQRAVLQLVLQRGRSYDEIAAMLSIDRAAVRDRALSAFDTIGPPTRVMAERRALITDYLMGQLPPRVAEQIFERLKSAPAERAWARALASDLSTLSRGPLPEIPSSVESTPPSSPSTPRTPAAPAPTPARPAPEASEPAQEPAEVPDEPEEPDAEDAEPVPTPRPRRSRPEAGQGSSARVRPAFADEDQDAGYGRRDDAGGAGPTSDRRGGAILIGIGVLVAAAVIVVAIILTNNGGSSKSPGTIAQTPPATNATATTPSTGTAGATTPTPTSSTAAGATTTPATGTSTTPTGTSGATGSTGSQVIAQFDLKAPSGGSSPKGVAQIIKQGSEEGIVLAATGVAANTTHNAYAVWLYSSPTKAHLLGFVNPAVKSNGVIKTASLLPANAASYGQVLITLETQQKPKAPGNVVLRGTLSLH
jgi:hypothetical protein